MKRYYPFTTTDTSVAVNVYRSSQSVPVHRHTFWEIFLVTRGSCTHASEAGVAVFVPGDVCIIPPETEHSFSMHGEVEIYNCQCFSSQLRPEDCVMLRELAEYDDVRGGGIRLDGTTADYMKQRFIEILREQEQQREDRDIVQRAALQLVVIALKRARGEQDRHIEQLSQGNQIRIAQATEYIEAHLSEHIDFAALAKRMYLSEKYFRQLFKEMTGLSPVEYVHRQRVVRSLIYLQKGCSVSEAGELVGWEDPNYYARVFKRVMGCPPKYFKQIEN